MGKKWKQWEALFWGSPKSLQMVIAAMKLKSASSLEENYDQPRYHIKKQRHYFANKRLSSQNYGFPVVMYGCESWTMKKAEPWRTDAFELWCQRRLLRVPWTARLPNQSVLKEISPEYSLEGLMLKLKLQYFGHLIGRTDSLKKTLMPGKTEGGRRRGQQRMSWLNGITNSMEEFEEALGVGDAQGSLVCCSLWGPKESDATEQLNWTELKLINSAGEKQKWQAK